MPRDFLSHDCDFCACGRQACGRGGQPPKRQNGGVAQQLLRQNRFRGSLQFRYLPPVVWTRPEDDCRPGWELDRAVRLGGYWCRFGSHFDVDTSVDYSLNKQNRWELLDSFFIDHVRCQQLTGLQVFLLEENFPLHGNRSLAPPRVGCQANLAWLLSAQSLLNSYRKALRRLRWSQQPSSGSRARETAERSRWSCRRPVTRFESWRQRRVEELRRQTQERLRKELQDDDEFEASQQVALPVRFNPNTSRLLNLRDLLVASPNELQSEDPAAAPLSKLNSLPMLVLRCVTRSHVLILDEKRHPALTRTLARINSSFETNIAAFGPKRRRSAKRQTRRGRRREARRDAADGLDDWLEEHPAGDGQDCDRGHWPLRKRPSSTLAEAADWRSLLAEFATDDAGFAEFSPSEGELLTERSDSVDHSPSTVSDLEQDDDRQEDSFRPVLTVQRELLQRVLEAGGGGRPSDSCPMKVWLQPGLQWPGPTLLLEELPFESFVKLSSSKAARFSCTMVRLHLLGCRRSRDRRDVLSRLLASQDPFGALPRLLSQLASNEGSDSAYRDSNSASDEYVNVSSTSGVRISTLTCPPLYSWFYGPQPTAAPTGSLARDVDGRLRLPPLLAQTAQQRRLQQLRLSRAAAACGTCGVRSPHPRLCDPSDWLTALTACGHWHCATCWTSHVTNCVAGASAGAVGCPTPGCGHTADPATVLWFSPSDIYYRCLRYAAWQPLL